MKKLISLFTRTDVLLFLACVLIFTLGWKIDIAAASLFYDESTGFHLRTAWYNEFIKDTFARIHILWLLLLIGGIAFCWFKGFAARRKLLTFMLVSMLVGPGLFVNVFLKENSIDRARPNEVQLFGGPDTFTPAFVYSGQCNKNCSFVSGHSAIGFYVIVLGWVFRSKLWFWGGFALGAVISLSRMMEGAHFLSDTVFAFWSVYFCTLLLGHWFGYPAPAINPFASKSR